MAFPPVPLYPKAIDDDSTLYLVYNTTETKICVENPAWSQEIEIIPVKSDKPEIWADNGFGNINGELFYYDSVEKNSDGKVYKLKDCARELGGSPSKWNRKGTWVRSYVVAEHHNQLVDSILKMEDFTGINFDERQRTLDWRIRNLEELAIIFDDFSCPDVNFTFNTTEIDNEAGVLATYIVEISATTLSTSFRLDFGDGEFTTTELSGTHTYAINATIDPVVTVSNDKCQIIQTPIERDNPAEPPPPIDDEFEVPFPDPVLVPDFTFVPCDVPEPEIQIPPIVLPCADVTEGVNISIGDINIPDQITTDIPGDIPSQIIVTGIPSIIVVDPPIPPTIVIDPPIPPTIVIIPPESQISLNVDDIEFPMLQIDPASIPQMEVQMTMVRPVETPRMFSSNDFEASEFGEEFADIFEAQQTSKIEYETVGLPEEIQIVAPDKMPKVEIDSKGLENMIKDIKLDTSEANIPTDIKIHGPESPIPTQIDLVGQDIPDEIELVYKGQSIPVEVEIQTPQSIKLEFEGKIPIEQPDPIKVDVFTTVEVQGFPEGIDLVIPEDIGIPLIFPEEMPTVEMVYRGSPIDLKISMDEMVSKDDNGNQCVMIVPCNK